MQYLVGNLRDAGRAKNAELERIRRFGYLRRVLNLPVALEETQDGRHGCIRCCMQDDESGRGKNWNRKKLR